MLLEFELFAFFKQNRQDAGDGHAKPESFLRTFVWKVESYRGKAEKNGKVSRSGQLKYYIGFVFIFNVLFVIKEANI